MREEVRKMAIKNKVLVIIGILFLRVVAIFVVKTVCAEMMTPSTNSAEYLHDLNDNPTSIILYGFDEKTYEITDEHEVQIIIETLKNTQYTEMDMNEYKEGFYMVDINYNLETVSMGIGTDCIAYGGAQYAVENGSFDEVISIFVNHLN